MALASNGHPAVSLDSAVNSTFPYGMQKKMFTKYLNLAQC